MGFVKSYTMTLSSLMVIAGAGYSRFFDCTASLHTRGRGEEGRHRVDERDALPAYYEFFIR